MENKSIAEQLYFTTIRIDISDQDGNSGSGTGFIFQHIYKDKNYPFIVTNKHVIKNAKKGAFTFIKKNGEEPKLGDSFRLEISDFESLWFNHQNDNIDISVTSLVLIEEYIKKSGANIFYHSIPFNLLPTEETLKGIDALEDIIFIGYPNGIWDSKNCTPIMRKGITATPITIDFEGEKKFLIDASVFGGSSGSPVFLYNSGSYITKGGRLKAGTRIHFVGVVASVFCYSNRVGPSYVVDIKEEDY